MTVKRTIAALALAMTASTTLSGCKVLTIEDDRALRARSGGGFDARQYVAEIWRPRALDQYERRAVPVDTLVRALDQGVDRAGAQLGRRVGEGSAWTFVMRGEGQVVSVDDKSRRGSVTVALTPATVVRVQTGPVVAGTALRDALPFVAFNDFPDQLAFADVGRALTDRALAGVAPVTRTLAPGQRVRFLGVANVRTADEPLVVTPVAITRVAG